MYFCHKGISTHGARLRE